MVRFYVVADTETQEALFQWLAMECGATPDQIEPLCNTGIVVAAPETGQPSVVMRPLTEAGTSIGDKDVVIVAGTASDQSIGVLLRQGIRNIFDGNEILARQSAGHRFLAAAANAYLGPTNPQGHGLPVSEAARFSGGRLVAGQVPAHKLFIVNSMPKSGTVWMAAMLEAILGVKAREQIVISHVADLEDDWNKCNNHGAVTLVRDMRDVVVSWFHNACRTDLELGFTSSRYPSVETFYHESFLATVRATKRFYFGDLEHWLDLVGANYIPLIRYEDLVADTRRCLRKLATFWQLDVSDEVLECVVEEHGFTSMQDTLRQRPGYVSDLVARGHLRNGRIGAWIDELPPAVADDIQSRFGGYQQRLGYDRTSSRPEAAPPGTSTHR